MSCYLIGNGETVDLWNSPWVPWLSFDSVRATFNPLIPTDIKVSSLLSQDHLEWDSQKLSLFFLPRYAAEF